jgi:2-polyprenyl-3-methyl-5-hydroxy-6-metoxy-1,4-benzoquinol methylase
MINYHTYYLNENKKSIEKWDFDSSNPTHLIGDYNHNLIANELLKNLSTIASNKDIIDIGCRDGFYSFLFEKISKTVTSLDMDNRETRQYVHSFLNSKSKFIHSNIYDIINWDNEVKYDVVFIADLLVHLENPIGALRLLHTICKEKIIIISDFFDDTSYNTDVVKKNIYFNDDLVGNGTVSVGHMFFPWVFSIKSLFSLLRITGFGDIKMIDTYDIESVNIKSINDPTSTFIRKVVMIEASPNVDTLENNRIYKDESTKGYKINPHFSSLYPSFKI